MVREKLSTFACRVCLNAGNYAIMDRENGWLELFEYCFGLQINPKDKARYLCQKCAEMIRQFTKFKQKCLESDVVWKSKAEPKVTHRKVKEFLIEDTNSEKGSSDLEEKWDIVDISFEPDHDKYIPIESEKVKSPQEQFYKYESVKNDASFNGDIESNENNDENKNECVKNETAGTSTQQSIHRFLDSFNCSEGSRSDNSDINDITDTKEELLCKCGKQYNYKTNYTMHIQKCHTLKFYEYQKRSEVVESCGLCEFSTQDINVLCKHLHEHYKKNDLECQLCDYTGRDFAEMSYHRYTHMQVSESRFYCLKCHKRFPSPLGLQFHFRSVHLQKKGGLCSFCGVYLSDVQSWKNHEKRKHANLEEGDSLYICDCCGLKFVFRNEIVNHLRERAGLHKHACDECGKLFKRQQNLNSHIKYLHTEQESVKCPKCPKLIKSYYLQKHIEIIHGEKKFVCEICSEKFGTGKALQYHMFTHTNERPYKCNVCGADFKSKRYLCVHVKRHNGLKPYVCNICQKAFFSSSQLRRHNSNMHTKERALKCEQCDKSFNYKQRLLKHCAKVHPIAPGMLQNC